MSVKESDLPREIIAILKAIRLHTAACLDALDAFEREVLIEANVGLASLSDLDEREFRAKVNQAGAEIARAADAVRVDVRRPHADRILQEREEAEDAG